MINKHGKGKWHHSRTALSAFHRRKVWSVSLSLSLSLSSQMIQNPKSKKQFYQSAREPLHLTKNIISVTNDFIYLSSTRTYLMSLLLHRLVTVLRRLNFTRRLESSLMLIYNIPYYIGILVSDIEDRLGRIG